MEGNDQRCSFRVGAVLGLASLVLAALAGSGWAEEFELVTVDNTQFVNAGFHTSLAFNGSRYPHIAYCGEFPEAPTYRLLYAFKDTDGWHIETIDDTLATCNCWTSLVLEGVSDLAHVSYVTSGDVKYAYRDYGGWLTPEDVDTAPGARNTSIALDHLGNPLVAYFGQTAGSVYLAVRSPSPVEWDVEEVDGSLGILGGYPSLGMFGDVPHISYVDAAASNKTVEFAYEYDDVWYYDTVHTTTNWIRGTSMRVRAFSSAVIAFRDGGAIKVASGSTGSWPLATADGDALGAESVSLGLTAALFPYVAYYDDAAGGGNLMLAYQDVTWEQELVDPGSFYAGEYPSLQFTGNDSPHISYCRGCVTGSGNLILADAKPGDLNNSGVYGSGDTVAYLMYFHDGRIPPGAMDCNLDHSVSQSDYTDYLCLLDKIYYQ